ncbi:HAD family hydrolase [Hymenobacter lutimineralis]|uniref:phosphoglycolate phosphatase n=1 Tax=Hymenobacter lutimineralis TaxID=2606448 RepID=A0A5D6V3B2_9BACT|nr:HAD family hydrolase [Hymenobacter lutimineralis]TYZ10036.1 HAD family hydrolase [Hymenobacter lutimineralis]
MSHPIDSIIFDLDGTLWNATKAVTQAFQQAAGSVDYISDTVTVADVEAVTGQPFSAVYDKLFPSLPAEKRDEFKAICAEQELHHARQFGGTPYPGLADTVRNLAARYRLFIVSNCQTGYIEAFFQHTQLEPYFEGHQCFGTKGLPKAENIKEVVTNFHLQAPVYVGDTRSDFEASQLAGVPFIFAEYGFGQVPAAEAPQRISQPADLLKLL